MNDIKKVTLVIEHSTGKITKINPPPSVTLNVTVEITGYTYTGFINKITNTLSWTTSQEIKRETNRLKSYYGRD